MERHMTFDDDAGMGYIYLAEPLKHTITKTDELPLNEDIILDFGKGIPIIGIELEGKTALKIKGLADEMPTFTIGITADGESYYSLRLNDVLVKRSVTHPDAKKLVFLFSDPDCREFIGIDIYDTKSYDESFLIG
ncbi:hypothetical protein [Peribacillus sp. YIM B13482]|uniref:hypothetical protein n=1 Tax=Peribacillus sp. YIM B13482 TaxID=3366298 RepID=UPI00367290FD